MKHTLIPHPRLNLAAPIVSLRELMLAAQGLQHKATSEARAQTIRVLSVQLCAAEELTRQLGTLTAAQAAKIADLKQRNAELTTALHRQACAGHAIPEVCGLVVLVSAALLIGHHAGTSGLVAYAIGFVLGLAWLALVLFRCAPAQTTRRRRVHPAHLTEPLDEARIVEAIRHRDLPLGETYPSKEISHHSQVDLDIASAFAGEPLTQIPPLSAGTK